MRACHRKETLGKLKEENTRIPAVLSSAIVSREAANRTHPALPKTDNRQPTTGKSAVLHSPGAACENIRSMAGTNRAWLRRGIR